jgi:two-component system LytT family sensor kinase
MRLIQRRRSAFALSALAFWTTVGLVFALPRLTADNGGAGWRVALLVSLVQWWSWGLIAPVVPWFDRLLPFPDAPSGRRIASHLGAGLAVTAAYLVISAVFAAALGVGDLRSIVDGRLLVEAEQGKYLWELLVYGMIAGGWLSYRYHRRSVDAELALARVERDFADARLNALRMQLDPHFLFNALNTISAHVQAEPRQARQMIEHLGELLRLTLKPSYRREVPLEEELEFLEHYLAIQRIRFDGRLVVELHVSPEARRALVPSLVLQPLVENAFRHGLAQRAAAGWVEIRAERRDNRLILCIADDGVGLPPGWTLARNAGIGLAVTRERVESPGPGGQGVLLLRAGARGGTEAEISLPFRVAQDLEAHHAIA